MESSEGVVWIAENVDAADSLLLTGRFGGYLDRGNAVADEFDDLPADAAIAWGRARSAVVLIRTGDSGYHSAGQRNPDPAEYPDWPPPGLQLSRRRPRGFETLDNSEGDPLALWDVRAEARHIPAHADPQSFHAAVRAHPRTSDVRAPAPGYSPVSAAFAVEASTYTQAKRVAAEITEEATAAFVRTCGDRDGARNVRYGFEVYPHRPGSDVSGPGVVY